MKTKMKLFSAIALVVSVVALLTVKGVSNASAVYLTVDEVLKDQSSYINKPLKMSGTIDGDSVNYDSNQLILSFNLNGKDGKGIPVRYKGAKPDTFTDGWEAIVEGKMDRNGTFIASNLLVKCPSKYEAKEEQGQEPPKEDMKKIQQQEGSLKDG